MSRYLRDIFLIIFLLHSFAANAQYDPAKVCTIENGKISFRLNLKWTQKEKKEISELFDLDSTLIARAFKLEPLIVFGGEEWKVKKLNPNIIELTKPLVSKEITRNNRMDDVFLLMDKWMNFSGNIVTETEIYGVNNFAIPNTFVYEKGNDAWFYLPGYKSADKVYISGSFNNWSTNQDPMKPNNTGWTKDLKLKPGKYAYKFIADGKWIPDPYNKLREKDGAGKYNSVVFCPNHIFELKGYEKAHRVVVTGNFLKWSTRGLSMLKTQEGWKLPIYFRDGTYAYKFIVDDQWIVDPSNKMTKPDSQGNLNSFISIGEPYLFKLEGFTDARKVILTGSFEGWSKNELLMERNENGWQLSYVVPAGNYEYKLIVDGKWMTDPKNPFSTGSGNTENSFIALKANHLFQLNNYSGANSVIATGSFNRWDKNGYRMKKENGKWVFPIFLKPGKYTYKFIIDGTWILDPENNLFEQNEYGTDNSVLWIEP
jgi:Glycogen recognition site of AMP-activated protein kinase